MEPNQLEQVELSELVEQQVPMTASTLARAATIPRKPNATRTDTMDSIKSTMTTRYSLSVTRGVAAVEPTLPRAKKEGEQEPELPGPMPTDEEMKQLPRIADSLPASAWLVVIAEFAERCAYYGVSAPFQNYVQLPYPYDSTGQRGGLGLGQATATGLNTFFQFWCYLTPIIGALISDGLGWGKFKTIWRFCFVYVLGLAILVGTSVPPVLASSTGGALAGLIIAMVVIGLATGSIKSNVSPFVADQYPYKIPFIRKRGEQNVIVDPGLTIQSVFNWFYLAINIGSLAGIFASTYTEKFVGFWLAYLIPSIVFVIVIIVLYVGQKSGVIKPDVPKKGSSVLVDAWKVFRETAGSFKGDFEKCAEAVKSKRLGSSSSTTLNKGSEEGAVTTKLQLEGTHIDETFVRDLQRALSACKVFVFFPIYWVCYSQLTSNLVSQAGRMDTNGVPNDVLVNFDPLFVIAFIPIFDRLIYPGFRKMGIIIRPILRISLGFFFASMAYSAYVQQRIYDSPEDSVLVWIQIPAYVFIAASEIFASITGLEFAYSRAPTSMKSVVMALFLLTSAFGSALGFALVPVSQDPYLTWMFGSLAVVAAIAGALLYLIFRGLDREDAEKEMRDLQEGRGDKDAGNAVAKEMEREAVVIAESEGKGDAVLLGGSA